MAISDAKAAARSPSFLSGSSAVGWRCPCVEKFGIGAGVLWRPVLPRPSRC
jgi:hypothetical protein